MLILDSRATERLIIRAALKFTRAIDIIELQGKPIPFFVYVNVIPTYTWELGWPALSVSINVDGDWLNYASILTYINPMTIHEIIMNQKLQEVTNEVLCVYTEYWTKLDCRCLGQIGNN